MEMMERVFKLNPAGIPAMFVLTFVLVFALIFVAGCGSSSGAADSSGNSGADTDPINLSDYEQFDTAQFPVEAPDNRKTVEHDVPASLLSGKADAGVAQVVSGYRIQVFASTDRDAAIEIEESVHLWWEELDPVAKDSLNALETLPVYNQFKQPLYRIRIGDFTRRSSAEQLMAAMAGTFETVFVVPDRVTIYR
jgi:hypothetical protein